MSRIYINSDEVRFTKSGQSTVDAEFYTGEKLYNLQPRRLFPVSGLTRYITLLDEEGVEKAVIRNVDDLMDESREIIINCLQEYYLVPKIIRLLQSSEKYGILKWKVETDRGIKEFDIKNRHHDIKTFYDGRVLVRDSDDNRYEIPDYNKLDKKSLKLLISEL